MTGEEAGLDHQTGGGGEQEDGHTHCRCGHVGHWVIQSVVSVHVRTLFSRDAGRYGRLPPPVVTPGHTDLVADVVSVLTEEEDGALLRETSAWRWIAAKTSMFGHQRVSTVARSACGEER